MRHSCTFPYVWFEEMYASGLVHGHDEYFNFYKKPNADTFNRVIDDAGELVEEFNIEELTEELYVHYEGESFSRRNKRVEDARDKLRSGKRHVPKYSKPHLLVWVYACIRRFPYLAHKCNQPLIIDRAYAFYGNSFNAIIENVLAGKCTNPNCGHQRGWDECVARFMDFSMIMFHASGDVGYLDHMVEVIRASNAPLDIIWEQYRLSHHERVYEALQYVESVCVV